MPRSAGRKRCTTQWAHSYGRRIAETGRRFYTFDKDGLKIASGESELRFAIGIRGEDFPLYREEQNPAAAALEPCMKP
jgi:hypothetical protein